MFRVTSAVAVAASTAPNEEIPACSAAERAVAQALTTSSGSTTVIENVRPGAPSRSDDQVRLTGLSFPPRRRPTLEPP